MLTGLNEPILSAKKCEFFFQIEIAELFSPSISNDLKFIPFNNLYRLFDGETAIIPPIFFEWNLS